MGVNMKLVSDASWSSAVRIICLTFYCNMSLMLHCCIVTRLYCGIFFFQCPLPYKTTIEVILNDLERKHPHTGDHSISCGLYIVTPVPKNHYKSHLKKICCKKCFQQALLFFLLQQLSSVTVSELALATLSRLIVWKSSKPCSQVRFIMAYPINISRYLNNILMLNITNRL